MGYELTFYEALSLIANSRGWMQGESFKADVVLMFDNGEYPEDYLHVCDFSSTCKHERKAELRITKDLLLQKYLVVYTPQMREVL